MANSFENLRTNGTPPQRSSLKDQAVSTLRQYIIAGDIPPGTQLVERDVAQLLNISRGPTREALLEIELFHPTSLNACPNNSLDCAL